ncbi:MAG: purine-cytosine permease family protein [Rhodococcus sp. (in: high G+C Gram-positive bacteria)]
MSSDSEAQSVQPIDKPIIELSSTDDPRVVAEQTAEEYTNHVVPLTARLDRKSVLASWSSIASAMAFVYYGALVATLVGITQAAIGIVISCVIYAAIAAVGGMKAIGSGLNSTLLSRELFGVKAAAICPLIIGFGAMFYAVFESSVLAAALQAYFGGGDIRLWYVVVIVCLLPLMFGGAQTWMGKINGISLPVYFFGLIAAVLAAGIRFGWAGDWDQFDAPPSASGIPGWLTVVVVYIGIWILLPEIQDMARMAKPADAKFHLNITFGIVFWAVAFLFNGIIGVLIVALAAGQPGVEPSEIGAIQGVVAALGIVGLLVIIVSQARINTANFYFASLSMERFVAHFTMRNLSRRVWVIVTNIVVLVAMFTDIFSYITTALAWMGVIVASWVGMQLVGWAFGRGSPIEFRPGRVKSVAPGFYVWVLATVIGIALIEFPTTFPTLSALAPLVTLIVSVIAYAVLLATGATSRRPVEHDDPRTQIQDIWAARVKCHICEGSYVGVEMDFASTGDSVDCLRCQTS